MDTGHVKVRSGRCGTVKAKAVGKEDTGKLKTLDDILKRFHALRDRYGKEDDEIVYKPSDEDDDYDEDGSSPGPPPVWAPIPDIRLRKNAMNGTATSGSPLPAA